MAPKVIDTIQKGILTLIDRLEHNETYAHSATATGEFNDEIVDCQAPDITLVACSDSRVLERSLDHQVGKIFSIKNIGNQVEPVMGSIVYGVANLKTPLLLILGHTGCGAIRASMDELESDHHHFTRSLEPIIPLCAAVEKMLIKSGGVKNYMEANLPDPNRLISEDVYLETLIAEANVDRQVDIVLDDDVIRKMVYTDKLLIAGAMYDFKDIYSWRKSHIFITNINGETNLEKLRNTSGIQGDRGMTHRVKRLLNYDSGGIRHML
jgi:carbonic anhydrase